MFLAGPKEHRALGRHEYEKDLLELAWSLERSLKNVKTVVLMGKPPRDLSGYAPVSPGWPAFAGHDTFGFVQR